MTSTKKYLQLNDISSYKRSLTLSKNIWNIIINWDWFAKRTVGTQFVTAVDSMPANIAEGFGRYGKKDKIKFYYYSFGSLKECLDWNEKSRIRNLLTENQYNHIFHELKELQIEIHQLIKFTKEKLEL